MIAQTHSTVQKGSLDLYSIADRFVGSSRHIAIYSLLLLGVSGEMQHVSPGTAGKVTGYWLPGTIFHVPMNHFLASDVHFLDTSFHSSVSSPKT